MHSRSACAILSCYVVGEGEAWNGALIFSHVEKLITKFTRYREVHIFQVHESNAEIFEFNISLSKKICVDIKMLSINHYKTTFLMRIYNIRFKNGIKYFPFKIIIPIQN